MDVALTFRGVPQLRDGVSHSFYVTCTQNNNNNNNNNNKKKKKKKINNNINNNNYSFNMLNSSAVSLLVIGAN